MCGIAGSWHPAGAPIGLMTDAIAHRGPDDAGEWTNALGLRLGHRRLSIVDLSPLGHQPMTSRTGRYVVVFNGEIYNFQALRQRLEGLGHSFQGTSDTEVMLACFEEWGIEASMPLLAGMFAIAAWDAQQHRLVLVRDRFGKKPLYYGDACGGFAFASELKAIRALPGPAGAVNRDALAAYLARGCVPGDLCITAGLHKLPPGCLIEVRGPVDIGAPQAYWSPAAAARQSQQTRFVGSPADAVDGLAEVLTTAVRERMVADVPLGAFLSGGIDSSTVVALMQEASQRPVRTFTIGYAEADYNEAEHAAAVANHLGTQHTEFTVRPEEALKVIRTLPQVYDEPFADSSQIPTILVSRLAREHVTVALTGDGGDEVFGGYTRYLQAAGLWRKIRKVPAPLRRLGAYGITRLPPAGWDAIYRASGRMWPKRLRASLPGDKVHKGARILGARTPGEIYEGLVTHWPNAKDLVIGATKGLAPEGRDWSGDEGRIIEAMMLRDTTTYLPDDILVKVDRATMSVALEARSPLLDHRVFEYAWRLPIDLKVRGGEGKWVLRQLLYRHVPPELMDRPKMGFGVPIGAWLRGPLHDWAAGLLDARRLAREGYLRPEPIRRKWEEHLSGRRNWDSLLWDALMFQAWLERNESGG